eukprot:CAMPEP_0182541832 /NCGR_PEP_ID=MMETSP1323-20130603/29227_1 /TAXON_ID=236787 /ORGANISM="Florenciella parvula, Strain RCC1693" /LENGTH=128 /DNA_ID=CAMNT_0024752633 /DNA_START=499 /DNA_END=881 /DNA_ORIENTATION=+
MATHGIYEVPILLDNVVFSYLTSMRLNSGELLVGETSVECAPPVHAIGGEKVTRPLRTPSTGLPPLVFDQHVLLRGECACLRHEVDHQTACALGIRVRLGVQYRQRLLHLFLVVPNLPQREDRITKRV